MKFDDIFQYFGDIGKYQLLILFLIGAPNMISDSVSLNFITARLDHWCHVPALQNLSDAQQKEIAIPYDIESKAFLQCQMYDLNYTIYNKDELFSWNKTVNEGIYNSSDLVECQAWNYDHSVFKRTTVSQFDLVCGKSNLIPLPGTLQFVGAFVGTLTSGFVSDKFGRKKVYFAFLFVRFLGEVLSAVSPAYWVFCLGKAMEGFAGNGYYVAGYLIAMEVIGPSYRSLVGLVYPLMFSASYLTASAMGYLIRDFRLLQGTGAAIGSLIFFTYPIIPDPPRWLIQHGREKEAAKVFRRLAKMNNIKPPDNLEEILDEIRKEEIKQREVNHVKKSVLDYYKHPNLLFRGLAIDFHWFTDSMMYYALSLNAGSLAGSIHLNAALLGLVEVPALILLKILINWRYCGRRLAAFASMFLAGCTGLVMIPLILYDVQSNVMTAMSLLGKAFITMAFNGIYVLTAETYPTEVRHACMAVSSSFARVGGMIAPYMGPPMADIWAPLPSLIFGTCATLSGLGILVVPETLNQPMCQTIEEAGMRTIRESTRIARSSTTDISKENGNQDAPKLPEKGLDNISFYEDMSISTRM